MFPSIASLIVVLVEFTVLRQSVQECVEDDKELHRDCLRVPECPSADHWLHIELLDERNDEFLCAIFDVVEIDSVILYPLCVFLLDKFELSVEQVEL